MSGACLRGLNTKNFMCTSVIRTEPYSQAHAQMHLVKVKVKFVVEQTIPAKNGE